MSTPKYELEHSLTIAERDRLMEDLDRDGFIILPQTLPQWVIEETNQALDRIVADDRKFDPGRLVFSRTNIIELDPMFRWLMMYKPALQMTYDCLGPEFVLSQDKFMVKFQHNPEGPRSGAAISWHSDGPGNFPMVDGRCPLHTLRFGFTLSDSTAEECGGIDLIRGSHKFRNLHARDTLHWQPNAKSREEDFTKGLVRLRVPMGAIYAFHNGLWHSAQPNRTSITRRIVYLQYTPAWMRPHHRADPTMHDLQAYTPEERWLLCEPRRPNSWMVGDAQDHSRLARFSRDAE